LINTQFLTLSFKAGEVFTPGAPINVRDLFAGRIEQLGKILDAVAQRGYHAVLYGERGVGKTSLANIASSLLPEGGASYVVPRVNCDGSDTFSSLWKRAFKDIVLSRTRPALGFTSFDHEVDEPYSDRMSETISPDEVRRAIEDLSKDTTFLFVFDEFDRLSDKTIAALMADTIKALSDFGVAGSVLIIGVASSVGELIAGHQSIERALIQIQMPRMSSVEVKEIIEKGTTRLGMRAEKEALAQLASLSQGLPYITHLLALHSTRAALSNSSLTITTEHVSTGIRKALEQWQETIKTSYYEATKSAQPGNIYKQVLLGCALAEIDDLGYFRDRLKTG
jgi:Cdc6-like AAA superfamily ATPase